MTGELLHVGGGRDAAKLRVEHPHFADWVDDHYQLRNCPNSIDWHAMPIDWQEAQREMAAEHEKLNTQLLHNILQAIEKLKGRVL